MRRRPNYRDLRTPEAGGSAPASYDLVQPKMDGWWITLTVRGGVMVLTSDSGMVVAGPFAVEMADCEVVGEYMIRTRRATASPLHGSLVVFDALSLDGADISDEALSDRLSALTEWWLSAREASPIRLRMIDTYDASEWRRLWDERPDEEGLVFKQSWSGFGAPWARMKRAWTEERVCLSVSSTSIETAEGTVVVLDIDAGMVDGGCVGRVMEVCGSADAPVFSRWRDDRAA